MPLIRLYLLFLAMALGCAVGAPGALAAPATYGGISSDGSVAVFSTAEQMVPGDTDQEVDVYVRAFDSGLGEYVTRQISLGPSGGNDTLPSFFDGISADGAEVFFSTREAMVPGDTDAKEDVYVRNLTENRTLLASRGDPSCAAQNCGNGQVDSNFTPGGVVAAGGGVFFTTTEPLVSSDQDSEIDIYFRDVDGEATELVSAGAASCSPGCGNGPNGAAFRGTDKTGDRAFFTSSEKLSSQDEDSADDIYQRDLSAGTTAMVSVPGTCPPELPAGQNCNPSYGGASPDGSHVFFETNEQLSGEDTDKSQDLYDWSGGTPALASIGPNGGNGNEKAIVTYAGSSGDGGTVYFLTRERLDTTADTDDEQDVYQHASGVTTLVSTGEGEKGNGLFAASFGGTSTGVGPQVVLFHTAEALTGADSDSAQDVYQRSGGVTTLVSIGPTGGNGGANASFGRVSEDGSEIYFATTESLVVEDTDSSSDIYRRASGETVLVSIGQTSFNGPFSPSLFGVSTAGDKAFFVTQERLTEGDDFAGEADVYSWTDPGTIRLVSAKNSSELVLGPPPPALEKTVPASPNPSTTPTIVGQAQSGSLVKIYKTFNCSGEPVVEGSAEELASPGLTVTPVTLGSTTNFRATAEAEGIVSPCSSSISYKQEEAAPPPPPPPPPGEEGSGGTGGTGTSGGKASGDGSRGVTYVTPIPRITFAPAFKTRLRRPTFRFQDATEQPGTKFFCRVDRQKWAVCTSPNKLKKLKLGRHVFSVKAVNAVGNAGPSPVKRAFKVVR
ncbi:MAG TPA: hypothetical protein VFM51_07700 [Solirubrobacterales bacterium]|nr:hypothetical protein [Solirubrobacterales bacterium]